MIGRIGLRAWVALVFLFLVAPILSVFVWSFSGGRLFVFPPSDWTLRWYGAIPADFLAALKVSLLTAIGSTALGLTVGVPAALALVRGALPFNRTLSALCLSPLMVPSLVLGVAAFQFMNVIFDLLRLSLLESVPGLVLAHAAFTVPFVIRAVIAGQVQYDTSVEEAALNLGATPLRAFFTVTLPMLAPAVASGAIFAFLMSFDDVPVALFVGGGRSTTLPVMILNSVQFNFSPELLALSSIVAGAIILLIVLCGRLFGIDKFMGSSHN